MNQQTPPMRILHLVLKQHWYNMIECGEKTEEYREIKPYWIRRIGICDAVRFQYGYTKRTMTFKCRTISIGRGRKEWGAPDKDVYVIKLGKRIK